MFLIWSPELNCKHFLDIFINADPCSEVNCGKHASCRIEGTEAFCVCAEGWTYNPKKISAGCLGKMHTT